MTTRSGDVIANVFSVSLRELGSCTNESLMFATSSNRWDQANRDTSLQVFLTPQAREGKNDVVCGG